MSILLSSEGEEGEEMLPLTLEEEEDAKKAFRRAEKNEYYIDRAGPDSERYSKPRLVGLEGNPTEEEVQRMKDMIGVVLKEDTHASLEKQQKEEKPQSNNLNNSGRAPQFPGFTLGDSDGYVSELNRVNALEQSQQQPAGMSPIGTPDDPLSGQQQPLPPQPREKTIEERWEKAVKDLVVVGTLRDGGDAEKRRNEVYEELMSVCKDFRAAASAYGKIVLLENAENNETRTIKTEKVGGFAGGKKYKIDDKIMFKSPIGENRQTTDDGLIYPSYDAEAKVSGHELKSAAHLFGALVATDIYVQRGEKRLGSKEEEEQRIRDKVIVPPLMNLVEYLGHRTVAMTVLPVGEIKKPTDKATEATPPTPDTKGSDFTNATLIYGSANARKTIRWDPEVHGLLGKVSKQIKTRTN